MALNTRPLVVEENTGRKILAPRRVDVLQQIAASTAVSAGEPSDDVDPRWRIAAYADGVASVLAWLNGERPSAELANLLELEDDE